MSHRNPLRRLPLSLVLAMLALSIRAGIIAALVGCAGVGAAQQHPAPPNILILLADDLGWGDVGFHQGSLTTPHLDQLAKEGVELQRFYAYPVCSPTRAALLTGRMPRRFGIADVVGPQQNLPAGIVTLPGTLGAAGYQTSLVGKWHLGQSVTPLQCGFDHFYGFLGPQIDYFKHTNPRGAIDWQRDGKPATEEGYSTYLFADEAVRQLKQHDAKRPFFMEVAFNAVHVPHSAPAELLAKYQSLGRGAVYAAVTEALDTSIGRILAALDEAGLRANTLVLFFSDNGAGGRDGGSNAPLRGGKSTVFEGGIRMPCLMRWPGHLKAGSVTQQPISAHDLFPTLAAAAGVPVKDAAKLDGKNLWEPLRDARLIDRGPFVIAATDFALIDGEWKLIETADDKRALYRISADLGETRDLLASQTEVAQRLGTKLSEVKSTLPAVRARPRPGLGSGQGGPGGAGPGQGRPRPGGASPGSLSN